MTRNDCRNHLFCDCGDVCEHVGEIKRLPPMLNQQDFTCPMDECFDELTFGSVKGG